MGISLEPPYLIIKPGMTEAQFYQMADEDSDWEYIAGRIVMHSPASDRHENVFRFLLTLFSNFLDEKGTVRQTDFRHAKSDACKHCTLDEICGGLFELGDHYDLGELHPVFVPREPIVARVLAEGD